MNMKFKDYTPEQIKTKLNEVIEFESKYGSNTTTQAWRKWCESVDYRKSEFDFRQATVNLFKYNNNIL